MIFGEPVTQPVLLSVDSQQINLSIGFPTARFQPQIWQTQRLSVVMKKGQRPYIAGRTAAVTRQMGKFIHVCQSHGLWVWKFGFMYIESNLSVHYFLLRFCNFS